MKKIFIALSVLAALTLGVGSALAVPGVPDLVPGCNFTVPFLVSKARVDTGSGATTALDLSEVKGLPTQFHLYFYTTKSKLTGSTYIEITPWGSIMTDIGKLLAEDLTPTDLDKLAYTFNGEDYYAGYISGYNNITLPIDIGIDFGLKNFFGNVIGSFYFLDLAGGKAGASNLPMREFYNQARQVGDDFYYLTWAFTQDSPAANPAIPIGMPDRLLVPLYERWSAVAMANATSFLNDATYISKTYNEGDPDQYDAPAAGWFALYPEYYILDSTGSTTFVLYQNGLANGSQFHMYVINAEEDYTDASITIDEVTFIDAASNIAPKLKVKYPYQGFFNWTSSDDMNASLGLDQDDMMWAEFLGWSWQKADNGAASAASNWTVLKQIARDVGTDLDGPFSVAPDPYLDLSELLANIFVNP